jgi:hypothetical protein
MPLDLGLRFGYEFWFEFQIQAEFIKVYASFFYSYKLFGFDFVVVPMVAVSVRSTIGGHFLRTAILKKLLFCNELSIDRSISMMVVEFTCYFSRDEFEFIPSCLWFEALQTFTHHLFFLQSCFLSCVGFIGLCLWCVFVCFSFFLFGRVCWIFIPFLCSLFMVVIPV